jgi:predicted lipoprotein with Yx(FWY)xxD motif
MTRTKPFILLSGAAAVGLIAVAVAGCGGGNNGAAAANAPSTKASEQVATVRTANGGDLGTILVDSNGRTLYLFEKDSGTTSECSGACASAWPPLRANGKPTAGSGVEASRVGTTTRSDGKPQVTYNGHPLYLFSGDRVAGDTNGQGSTAFGASWFALNPAGDAISGETSGSGAAYDSDDSRASGGY